MDQEAGPLKKKKKKAAGSARDGILENLEEVGGLEKISAGKRKSALSGPGEVKASAQIANVLSIPGQASWAGGKYV